MNNLISNKNPKQLFMTGYGKSVSDNVLTSIATDDAGRMILSNELNIDTEANDLDIRPLNWGYDSATITIPSTDIRSLSGNRDAANLAQQSFVEANQSATIAILSTINLVTRDISQYSRNTFLVRNTSGISVSVNVSLQIAPINNDAYYINDGSSYSLIGGDIAVFQPTQLLRYARIRVSALLALANITVYYFGQT